MLGGKYDRAFDTLDNSLLFCLTHIPWARWDFFYFIVVLRVFSIRWLSVPPSAAGVCIRVGCRFQVLAVGWRVFLFARTLVSSIFRSIFIFLSLSLSAFLHERPHPTSLTYLWFLYDYVTITILVHAKWAEGGCVNVWTRWNEENEITRRTHTHTHTQRNSTEECDNDIFSPWRRANRHNATSSRFGAGAISKTFHFIVISGLFFAWNVPLKYNIFILFHAVVGCGWLVGHGRARYRAPDSAYSILSFTIIICVLCGAV